MKWNVSKKDINLIHKIALRSLLMFDYGLIDIEMDITACHLNGCPLKLEQILDSRMSDFIHDIGGIRQNLDRKTGKLKNCFFPRFAKPTGQA